MRGKEILPFVTTWMKLEGIVLSKTGQIGKYKYGIISLICGILKKKKAEFIQSKITNGRG